VDVHVMWDGYGSRSSLFIVLERNGAGKCLQFLDARVCGGVPCDVECCSDGRVACECDARYGCEDVEVYYVGIFLWLCRKVTSERLNSRAIFCF
jgi:hypothetical protein